jgi:3-phenylpropionate/trans-cinnamate dioxygenase ferredoxin reductase subunit
MTTPGIVIIGGGECGARAALTLRTTGWTGAVTLVGAESALPYERPPLSKQVLTSPDPVPPATVLPAQELCRNEIRYLAGTVAVEIDRYNRVVVLGDGARLPYTRLLMATGARPRRLPGPAGDGVRYLRTYDDALGIRERLGSGVRVGIIGAGFVGMELAASAAVRGCLVTVIEMGARPMPRLVPAPLADIVAERHRAAGVRLRFGATIAQIGEDRSGWHLELGSGEPVDCDVLVAAIGALPNTELAEEAGLEVSNGVSVDTCLRTSDPYVYAAGDCCSFPCSLLDYRRTRLESWSNACEQATFAARNMLGADIAYESVPWFWSDQFDLTMQIAGMPDESSTEVIRQRDDGILLHFQLARNGGLASASAIGVGSTVAKDIRLAQRLIASGALIPPDKLADPAVTLKSLLSR